jgi:hypothetical protein
MKYRISSPELADFVTPEHIVKFLQQFQLSGDYHLIDKGDCYELHHKDWRLSVQPDAP